MGREQGGVEAGEGGTHVVFNNGDDLPEALSPILLGFNPAIEHLQSSTAQSSAPVPLGWWTLGLPGVPGRTIFLGHLLLPAVWLHPPRIFDEEKQAKRSGWGDFLRGFPGCN